MRSIGNVYLWIFDIQPNSLIFLSYLTGSILYFIVLCSNKKGVLSSRFILLVLAVLANNVEDFSTF